MSLPHDPTHLLDLFREDVRANVEVLNEGLLALEADASTIAFAAVSSATVPSPRLSSAIEIVIASTSATPEAIAPM